MKRFRNFPAARTALWAAVFIAAAVTLRRFFLPAVRVSAMAAGAAVIISPICRLYEKKLSRGPAAALAVMSIVLALILAVSIIPYLAIGFSDFAHDMLKVLRSVAEKISTMARTVGMDFSGAPDNLSDRIFSAGTKAAKAVVSTVSGAAEVLVASVVCIFLLKDRDRLLLHLELFAPCSIREKAVRCASAAYGEIMLYIRAQLIISLCVGLLSAVGLFVIGVPYGLLLGALAGIFNIIPYLGPIVASVPVALSALTVSLPLAIMSVIIMIAVQQIDGLIISPRIMGSVTGFHCAVVMIAVFSAGAAFGIVGMLLVLPTMILIRTCMRVFVESNRNH